MSGDFCFLIVLDLNVSDSGGEARARRSHPLLTGMNRFLKEVIITKRSFRNFSNVSQRTFKWEDQVGNVICSDLQSFFFFFFLHCDNISAVTFELAVIVERKQIKCCSLQVKQQKSSVCPFQVLSVESVRAELQSNSS